MSHVRTGSATERVYRQVKEEILINGILGGELISEAEIAGRYGVSRTPVREAFLRLESEGWMKLYPKRGALVLPIAEREARDVLEARTLCESHAVRSVVGRTAELAALLADLRVNLERHRVADINDLATYARIDAEFHQLIVTAGDNPLLAGFYVSLGERHRRMTSASVGRDTSVPDRILADHAELITAIESTDPDKFDAALARHLIGVHDLTHRR